MILQFHPRQLFSHILALSRTFSLPHQTLSMAARNALLKYLRVEARRLPQNPNVPFQLSFNLIRRHFSEEIRGTFLDKSEVTDRVISVVKNFQKVDPSKLLWLDGMVKPLRKLCSS